MCTPSAQLAADNEAEKPPVRLLSRRALEPRVAERSRLLLLKQQQLMFE